MHVDIAKLAPCPKCGEHKRLTAERHASTAFARCEACNYKGTELLPRRDMLERELLAAVIRAWNNVPR
jgi:hypothetical protein